MFIFSGIIAGALAYVWNKLILKDLGERGLVALVPFIEEFFKTIAALFLKAGILQTHFVFGCIEGIYDIYTSSKKIGKWAALASIISHSFFGGITYLVYNKTSNLPMAIVTAWIFHSGWNWYITKYF